MRLAADARERVDYVALDAGELRHGLPYVACTDHISEIAMAREVGDALSHLVVQDLVVFLGVLLRVGVGRLEEALLSDLLFRDGDVRNGELHARVRAEVVIERGEHREDVLLVLATCRLVGDVRELDRLREEPFLDLRDAVLVDGVVADEGSYVAR